MIYYGTLIDAADYLQAMKNDYDRVWLVQTESDKERYLKQATFQIERLRFKGDKTDPEQELKFPRDGSESVPKDIEYANYELAYAFADGKNVDFLDEASDNTLVDIPGIKSRRNANIINTGKIHGIPSVQAWRLLQPYVEFDDTVTFV